MPDPLYTPAQVAEIMQVRPDTVLLWCRKGYLRSVKLGPAQNARVRIPKSAVDDFKEGRNCEDHG